MKKYYIIAVSTLVTLIVVFYLIFFKVFLHEPANTIRVSVQEPSGLTIDFRNSTFWTVSDQTGKMYNIDMDGNTIFVSNLKVGNLEGITCVNDSLLAVVDEDETKVLIVNYDGEVIKEKKLPLKHSKNRGLEGIAFDKSRNCFYVLTESKPGRLVTIDDQLEVTSVVELSFADDYSGLYYDEPEDNLWIVSDESKMVARCNIHGDVISSVIGDYIKLEGIAVTDSIVYAISDRTSLIHILKKQNFF